MANLKKFTFVKTDFEEMGSTQVLEVEDCGSMTDFQGCNSSRSVLIPGANSLCLDTLADLLSRNVKAKGVKRLKTTSGKEGAGWPTVTITGTVDLETFIH